MFIGPNIINDGLVLALDPSNVQKHGTSPYKNLAGNGSKQIVILQQPKIFLGLIV